MEDEFHGFLPERGRSSCSFTIVQNHFTSLYIPSNNFIEEALSHCSCVQAFVGIHVWSCRHLWVGPYISRVSYRLIGRSIFRFHCREGMDIGCIKYIYRGLTLTPCGEKDKKEKKRARESSILFAQAFFFCCGFDLIIVETVDILQGKNIDWKKKKFFFEFNLLEWIWEICIFLKYVSIIVKMQILFVKK